VTEGIVTFFLTTITRHMVEKIKKQVGGGGKGLWGPFGTCEKQVQKPTDHFLKGSHQS